MRLTITSEPRANVRLQVSDELVEWQDLKFITNETGMAELVDQKTNGHKFYRLVAP